MNAKRKSRAEFFDFHQIRFYAVAIISGAVLAALLPVKSPSQLFMAPALIALFLVTFIQIPFGDIIRGLRSFRFLAAIFIGNFIFIPLLLIVIVFFLWALSHLWFLLQRTDMAGFYESGMIELLVIVFAVLLSPCIDYVVSFCRMAKGNAAQLAAVTPILLFIQYVAFFFIFWISIKDKASATYQVQSFMEDVSWIFILPLCLAFALQMLAPRDVVFAKITGGLKSITVPVTAFALFVIMAYAISSILPKLGFHGSLFDLLPKAEGLDIQTNEKTILPSDLNELKGIFGDKATIQEKLAFAVVFYLIFALTAPVVGWVAARLTRLQREQSIAVMFSVSTRNSLVILPFFMVLDRSRADFYCVVILTQTCVELVSQMFYVKWIPRLASIKEIE